MSRNVTAAKHLILFYHYTLTLCGLGSFQEGKMGLLDTVVPECTIGYYIKTTGLTGWMTGRPGVLFNSLLTDDTDSTWSI